MWKGTAFGGYKSRVQVGVGGYSVEQQASLRALERSAVLRPALWHHHNHCSRTAVAALAPPSIRRPIITPPTSQLFCLLPRRCPTWWSCTSGARRCWTSTSPTACPLTVRAVQRSAVWADFAKHPLVKQLALCLPLGVAPRATCTSEPGNYLPLILPPISAHTLPLPSTSLQRSTRRLSCCTAASACAACSPSSEAAANG